MIEESVNIFFDKLMASHLVRMHLFCVNIMFLSFTARKLLHGLLSCQILLTLKDILQAMCSITDSIHGLEIFLCCCDYFKQNFSAPKGHYLKVFSVFWYDRFPIAIFLPVILNLHFRVYHVAVTAIQIIPGHIARICRACRGIPSIEICPMAGFMPPSSFPSLRAVLAAGPIIVSVVCRKFHFVVV